MSKINSIVIAAVAFTGVMMISGTCWAQGCTSCGPGVANASASFGYPTGGAYNSVVSCDSCGCGSGHGDFIDHLKAKHAHNKYNCQRVIARNEAWPMPFNCADRQLYFSFWEPMIDQGFEEQCVLTSAHFDPESGKLNSYGKHAVAGIMQNMPSTRRKVFIHRDADVDANAARMAAVQNTIDTFYNQSGPALVEFSNKLPVRLRGTKAEAISRLGMENHPTPVIPISSGAQSVGSSVSQ